MDKVKKGHADYVRDMAGELAVALLQIHTLDDYSPKHEAVQLINHHLRHHRESLYNQKESN